MDESSDLAVHCEQGLSTRDCRHGSDGTDVAEDVEVVMWGKSKNDTMRRGKLGDCCTICDHDMTGWRASHEPFIQH